MIASSKHASEQRLTPRMVLPVGYTMVRAGISEDKRHAWTGQIFDIGAMGMRFGLDRKLRVDTYVYIRALLPGTHTLTINVQGSIVYAEPKRDAKLGLYPMGLAFKHFDYLADRRALISHLRDCGLEVDTHLPHHAVSA